MTAVPTKVRPKTQVGFVGTAEASITTGASIGVVMPAGLSAGQDAYFLFGHDPGATITQPSDGGTWTTEVSTPTSAPTTSMTVKKYTVQSGDSGVTKTFTISGVTNKSVVAAMVVYPANGGYSVKPTIYVPADVETQNSRPARIPTFIGGPDDLVVAMIVNYSYLSTAASGAEIDPATIPANFTLRNTISRADNALVYPRGATIIDADGGNVNRQVNEFEFVQDGYYATVMFALAPQNPRWKTRNYVPPGLRNKPVIAYTTSSNAYVKKPETNWGYNTKNPWGDRIDLAVGQSANSRNYALPGSKAEDICAALFGTRSYSTRATLADPMAISRACTFTALPDNNGIYLLDLAGNNIISSSDSQQVRDSLTNSIRSIVRKIRTGNGGVSITSQNAGITYTGTWTNGTSDGSSGGVYKQTTVPGSKASMSVNNTTGKDWPWEIVLQGLDSAAMSAVGSTFNVKVDGVSVYSGTTHNQAVASAWGGGGDYKYVQMVIPIIIPTGVHTLEWEHTGANGDVLRVDSVHVASATNPPPLIYNVTLARMPDAAYTTYPALSLAKQTEYSAIIKSVCDEFADGRVIYYDPSASGIVTGQTSLFASDHVHQADALHANFSWEMIQMLQERFA